jgi:hypothetical protein
MPMSNISPHSIISNGDTQQMKTFKLSSLSVLVFSVISMVTLPACAALDNVNKNKINEVNRDIKIMSNILKTTLSDKVGHNNNKVKGRYLANQGLMFEITIKTHYFGPRIYSDNKVSLGPVMAPMPPMPPMPNIEKRVVVVDQNGKVTQDTIIGPDSRKSDDKNDTENVFEYEFEVDEIEGSVEDAMDIRIAAEGTERVIRVSADGVNEFEYLIDTHDILDGAMPDSSSKEKAELRRKHFELRKKQHHLERIASKIERKSRELERQIRDAELAQELGAKAEKSEKMKSLELEMYKLSEQLKAVNKELGQHRDIVAKQVKEAKKSAQERQQKLTKQYAMTISEVVCDFAGGLRSIKNDQFMTFFVNDASQMYYVFSNKDIEKCQSGKIKYKELLSKATTYSL